MIRHIAQPHSRTARKWPRFEPASVGCRSRTPPRRPHPACLAVPAGGDPSGDRSFLVAYGGNQKHGGPKIRFPAVQVESTSFSYCTHTGVGPSVWDAAHPRSRRCPTLSRCQPPGLRPRKVVPALQTPCCQKSPSDPRATSGLCAH